MCPQDCPCLPHEHGSIRCTYYHIPTTHTHTPNTHPRTRAGSVDKSRGRAISRINRTFWTQLMEEKSGFRDRRDEGSTWLTGPTLAVIWPNVVLHGSTSRLGTVP